METQLEDIIRKIQEEGVDTAEKRSREIIEAAEKQAAQKIHKAQTEAQTIIDDAKKEHDRLIASGEAALQQAGRDLILAVQKRVTAIFESVTERAVGESLTADRIGEIIVALIEQWQKTGSDSLEVLVPESDRTAIESALKGRLSQTFAAGVEVRPVAGITAGFRIGEKGGASYYDFSADSLAELLSAFLNPRLSEIMKNAAGA